MDNSRTQTARDTDDRDLIESIAPAPGQSGAGGGGLALDIASQSEAMAVEDPEGSKRVAKADDIAHADEVRPDRARGA